MRKWVVSVAFILAFGYSYNVGAAVRMADVEPYLHEFGWTESDLQRYLLHYHRTLADFATPEELKRWLGPPVTEAGVEQLLQRYQLTEEQLEALLGQFGETMQDYTWMNDLDAAVRFYLRSYENMQRVHDALSSLEFTEDEAKRLFDHVRTLPANGKRALQAQAARLAEGKNDLEAIADVWKQLLRTLRLKGDMYVVSTGQMKPVSAHELLEQTTRDEDVWIALSDEEGMRIMDLQLPKRTNVVDAIIETEKELLTAGQLAYDMKRTLYGQKMANTASPYVAHMLWGVAFLFVGLLLFRKKKVM
ncbi:processed acidic surface protein [Anoxybacteroides amylolyticum]|uniref:Processed acidic surface protein n=1 Tax=Anoxybacteroides amylolyticum TaxID=294699 RepID=A0A167SYQ4_9BACL|nr:processed acidic surface protein [Anoxybacillus amylolyticus]ANB59189.1 processed acidic surface protein [Anoxybacillus amylolyticus]